MIFITIPRLREIPDASTLNRIAPLPSLSNISTIFPARSPMSSVRAQECFPGMIATTSASSPNCNNPKGNKAYLLKQRVFERKIEKDAIFIL